MSKRVWRRKVKFTFFQLWLKMAVIPCNFTPATGVCYGCYHFRFCGHIWTKLFQDWSNVLLPGFLILINFAKDQFMFVLLFLPFIQNGLKALTYYNHVVYVIRPLFWHLRGIHPKETEKRPVSLERLPTLRRHDW